MTSKSKKILVSLYSRCVRLGVSKPAATERRHVTSHCSPVAISTPSSILVPFTTARVRFSVQDILSEFLSHMSIRHRSNVQRYTVKINIGPDLPTHSPSPHFSQPRPMPPNAPNLDWSSSGCDRLDNLFDKFWRLETSLSGESERFLVKPSGKLSGCRLIVRMHYPNFCRCRKFFNFLDMVDIFNTSMATLMDKLGIWNDRSCGRVLLQDLFYRRIPIPTGTNKELNRFGYHEDLVKAHVQFADDVWEQWDAPVGC
jgi:hypothetical protein